MNAVTTEVVSTASTAVQRTQERQEWARDAIYEILNNRAAYTPAEYEAAHAEALAAYEATVRQLEALLGPNAACVDVDCDLSYSFSDCFKAENGCRPTFHMTRQDVLAWFERLKAQQVEQEVKEITIEDLPKPPPSNLLRDRLMAALNITA